MDWWHLQKIVGQLLSDRDVGKVCLGVTDDGYEARVIIATWEGGKKVKKYIGGSFLML